VLVLTGGGSNALADLLAVPGASRTVLEAVVPYSEGAMIDFLGGRPDRFCSPQTARAMAMAAFHRALRYGGGNDANAGISCTASLATDRPKRGDHRAHLALQTATTTVTWSLQLAKQRRTRLEEERLVSRLALNAVADACEIQDHLELNLYEDERLERTAVDAQPAWRELLLGSIERVRQGDSAAAGAAAPPVVFPGAFNPLHAGHRGMACIAEEIMAAPVAFEISIINVDKPPLDYFEIDARTRQFTADRALWLTRSSTFEEKSRLFPAATFVVGSDTLARIGNPRYYGNDSTACRLAIERIADRGCHFLVFGRYLDGRYVHVSDLDLPERLRSICREVPEQRFREDISSAAIRRQTVPRAGNAKHPRLG